MEKEVVFGTIFIMMLHITLWMKWAKLDYERYKKGMSLLNFKRLLDLVNTLFLTLGSVFLIDYWRPDNSLLRLTIDILAVSIVIWYRVFFLPKKRGKEVC